MYEIKKRYHYTKEQEKLIELQRETERVKGIVPRNWLMRWGKWLQLKGLEWQTKGLLIKSGRNKSEYR